MGRIVVSQFITLDGVIEAPHEWSFPYWNDEIGKFKFEELFASDGLLLGRETYEGFAAAWPDRTDEQGYADRINNMPKHVISTTLENATWNNSHITAANVVDEIARLRQGPGRDILVFGSGELVDTLIHNNLVDEYRLLVYPVFLGRGIRLFRDGNEAKLKLVESKPFGTGVVLMRYEPDEEK